MCICVDPEDHECAWCSHTSPDHRENIIGQFVCSELCQTESNKQIRAFWKMDAKEDLKFPDQEE